MRVRTPAAGMLPRIQLTRRLRQNRIKVGEDGDQQCNRADPNERTNGASSQALPYGLDKTFNWIAGHNSYTPATTGKPRASHDFK